jgi:hypothetical protein
MVNLLAAFHPKPVFFFLSIRLFSYKQQIIRSSFNPIFQTVSFDGGLSLLTFNVNIDRYVVIPSI